MPSFLAKAIKRNSLLDKLDIHLARVALKSVADRAKLLIDPVGFHPSQINACLRSVFYAWCGVPMDNPPKPKTQRIFNNGDHYHLRMQGYFRDMGILEGEWNCKKCGLIWNGIIQPCPSCKAVIYKQKFKEIHFHKGYMIGASDGIVHMDERRIIIELKSINSRGYSQLKKPLDHHREQGNCYMYALDVDECAYIYENKDTQEIKIFIERRDDKIIAYILKHIINFIDKYWRKKILPPRECENSNWCPYQKECYILKRSALALLASRKALLKENKNASQKDLEEKTPVAVAGKDGKSFTNPPTGTAVFKNSSRSVDKKSLLTHSAKTKLRKHGGRFSK